MLPIQGDPMFRKSYIAMSMLSVLMLPVVAQAEGMDLESLKQQLQLQQQQIDALATALEKQHAGNPGLSAGKTTLGGYGEAYFKHIDGSKDEFDAYRLVLFVGHQFSDKLRFASELEVEHALVQDTSNTCTFTDKDADGIVDAGELNCTTTAKTNGYVALEQLFLEYRYAENHRAAVGQLLVPVGILNETHEPDTFYGVFRAPVEREIVPGTWYETGLMASGTLAPGLSYDALVSSGLKNAEGKIKDGRQRGSKADGSDLAYTARLKYTGLPGVEFGVTWQQQADMAQGGSKVAGTDLDASLAEAHVAVKRGAFGLRALYAEWDLNDAAMAAADRKRSAQKGWYVEPSFKVLPEVGIFARYSVWDNEAGDVADSEWQESSVGVNWWLHERAVLKADLQRRDDPNPANPDQDGFNVGMGFSF